MLITDVKVSFSDTTKTIFQVNIPEKCPHCGKSMSPRVYSGFSDKNHGYRNRVNGFRDGTNKKFCLVLQCVLCNAFYIGNFEPYGMNASGDITSYRHVEVSYIPPVLTDIPDNVSEISERFGEIYKQSLQAKEYGLNEIYGMGLRKSLEFLVKDFAIYLVKKDSKESSNSEKEIDTIKTQALGLTISSKFKEFSNFEKLFRSASWIGNDETHYVRKHPDKDAEFLNSLIKVLANNVSNSLIEQEAMKLVDDN